MSAYDSQNLLCDEWGFYVDIDSNNENEIYNDNYTKMKEKYKIKQNFYTNFEVICEDKEYYSKQEKEDKPYEPYKPLENNSIKLLCTTISTVFVIIIVYLVK